MPSDKTEVNWTSEDPFTVLGVSASASSSEIQKAYHDLMSQYHPDKVASLAPEFLKIAEDKSKVLNWAHDECLKRKAA